MATLVVLLLVLISFVFLLLITVHTLGVKKRLYAELELFYPKEKYERKARRELIKILVEFNKAFYHEYPNVKNDDFNSVLNSYPRQSTDQSKINRDIELYKTMIINKKALKMIEKLLPIHYTIKAQIDSYRKEKRKAQRAQSLIFKEDFQSYFPELYKKRARILKAIENNCLRIEDNLEVEKSKFEDAIQELVLNKKKGVFEKAGLFAWNMATAPVRHVVNIIEGFGENDPRKIGKSATMLVLGVVGVGLAFEAIDGLEGLDGSGAIALDDSSVELLGNGEPGSHFVEPHARILPDGTEIWIDGDGDTSVNLTVEEGGGYYRSNPVNG